MRYRRIAFLAGLLAAMVLSLASPVLAQDKVVLHALTARTGPGTGTAYNVGASRNLAVFARITAGSGTVNPFDVWLECSVDGTNFSECALDDRVEGTTTGAGPHTDNTIKLVAETAVTTSAIYSARVSSYPLEIRARWNIAGTTPSETFEVVLLVR